MRFLKKNYRPWSIPWILQRFLSVVREGRLPQIRLVDLLYDFKLTRKINASLRSPGNAGSQKDQTGEDIFNFRASVEYSPMIVNESLDTHELSHIHHYFDHIYVINLGKRLDRRVEMIQKLNKYRIRAEIFSAVDGYSFENQQEFSDFYKQPVGSHGTHSLEKELMKKMIPSPGAWGYLKTYKSILSDAARKKYRKILCFDDDVLFRSDFENVMETGLKQIPSSWKLFYLGATQHAWDEINNYKDPGQSSTVDPKKPAYYHPVETDGSFAVGIDHSVFDEILKELELMNCAFDSGALRALQQKYPRECFVITPNLVIADVRQSDIGVERDQAVMAKKLRWDMSIYDYPFEKELVSVIMPAYNAEKTIEKSIRSILLQGYKELELIVVDDGSSDRTPGIVQKISKEDKRVKLVRQDTNQGCYVARNRGLRESKGKYIAIQDSDDISLNTRIETQLIPLMLGKAEFTLTRILRSRCTMDELDIHDQKEMVKKVIGRQKSSTAGLYEYYDRPVIGLMTSMFKRSLFEELGLFWENRFGSDAEFLERVLYYKSGKLLIKGDLTIHNYLMNTKSIPVIYERIDKIQLISPEMNTRNITNTYSKKLKDDFEATWRSRLKGEYHYNYPKI